MNSTLVLIGGVTLIAIILLFLSVLLKARKVNLTESGSDKPEWMRSAPPEETQAAIKEDQQGMAVFDQDSGEKLAAPFAEQIEDILRAKVESDPHLKQFKIDLGSSPDGGLEIWVNGKPYNSIESLPDENLQAAFRQAVEQWNRI